MVAVAVPSPKWPALGRSRSREELLGSAKGAQMEVAGPFFAFVFFFFLVRGGEMV